MRSRFHQGRSTSCGTRAKIYFACCVAALPLTNTATRLLQKRPRRDDFLRLTINMALLTAPLPLRALAFQILTLNSSPVFTDAANAANNSGINSRSFKLTTSTGECIYRLG